MAVVYASTLSFTNKIGGVADALGGESTYGLAVFTSLTGSTHLISSTVFKKLTGEANIYIPTFADTLPLTNSLRQLVFTSLNLNNNIILTNDISKSLSMTNTITQTSFKQLSFFNHIGSYKVYISKSFRNYLTSTAFYRKNFHGSLLHGLHNIHETVYFPRLTMRNGLVTQPYIFKRLKGYLHLHDEMAAERIQYEYKVILDGDRDVTALIDALSLTYAIEKFCGEVSISWADYTVYQEIDIADIRTTYGQERIEVFTRLVGETDWVSQGKFYLERRGLAANYRDIRPTSWGRTRSALLSGPYASPLTKTWDEDTTALAIATEMASLAGVTLHWEIIDYPVLGGNLTVDGAYPIDVISQLITAVGGVFVPKKDGSVRVVYRFDEVL